MTLKRQNIERAEQLNLNLKNHEAFLEAIGRRCMIGMCVVTSQAPSTIFLNPERARDIIISLMNELESELVDLGVEL